MKAKLLLSALCLMLTATAFAQSPQQFNYQGVARDNAGNVLADQNIGLRIKIHQTTATGPVVYSETHAVTTNGFGLFNIHIGEGSGNMQTIDWSNGPYYNEVGMDAAGGTNYTVMGTSQLLSVPYALHAENAWSRIGNAGTVDGTHFIGTTDNRPLNIKVNNENAGRIDPVEGNTFYGYKSGKINTGTYNTGNGWQTLSSNTTGGSNVAVGAYALSDNTTGEDNSAIGRTALYHNTTGRNNTANGSNTLVSNTTGNNNTASGSLALYYNLTGNNNTANGKEVLYTNSTGSDNTASGYQSLYSNTNGYSNTANGSSALFSNTEGFENTASGYKALYANTTGYYNTANGFWSLYANTTGIRNTASGYYALTSNTTGLGNTAIGLSALYSNTTGGLNTASGLYALYFNTIESNNTALGYSAGDVKTAEQATFVGSNCNPAANGYSNISGFGYNAKPIASNSVRVGNASVTSIGGYAAWTNLSDGRYKKNVQEDVKGLEFILKLRPVTYHLDAWKLAEILKEDQQRNDKGEIVDVQPDGNTVKARNEKEAITQSGFIAQEVEKAGKESGYDFSGVDRPQDENGFYGLRYAEFVVPLVKAVQEQQLMIEKQNATIEALTKRLEALEKN